MMSINEKKKKKISKVGYKKRLKGEYANDGDLSPTLTGLTFFLGGEGGGG